MLKSPDQVFDELLVLRYKSGDKEAIEILIKRWHERIKKQITRHTYEGEVAEDIAQEVWEAILKGIYNLREPALFGIWALRISTRKAIDWIRRNQKERRLLNDFSLEVKDDVSEEDDRMNQLQNALKGLPDTQRIILMLHYLEKFQVVEIASILEIPPGTVKSRLFNARKKLKELIIETYHEKQDGRN